MSAIYAQRYKSDPQEKHFEEWCKAKGGRIAQLPSNHPAIEVQRNIFMKQVKALDLDIEHLVKEPNYKQAFKTWAEELQFDNAFELLFEDFLEKIKSYEDPDPDQRDRDARTACERYNETGEAKYFEEFLEHNQKLYIQALKLGKNIMQLQLRDQIEVEFYQWAKTCPWKGDPYDFCIYLLKHPKGPSGYDNKAWGKTMMKCFYIGDNHWFHTCDRTHQERFVKEKDPDNQVELKPIQQMIKDLKNAQQAQKALDAEVPEVPVPEVPEVTESSSSYEITPIETSHNFTHSVVSIKPKSQAQPQTDTLKDLMAQLEKSKKLQEQLEQQIAMQNEKAIMQDLKPKYEDIVQKINKKRSFQNLTFDFGDLPPTKRAKTFKADINKFIKDAQDKEKAAHNIREAMKREIAQRVQNFFN